MVDVLCLVCCVPHRGGPILLLSSGRRDRQFYHLSYMLYVCPCWRYVGLKDETLHLHHITFLILLRRTTSFPIFHATFSRYAFFSIFLFKFQMSCSRCGLCLSCRRLQSSSAVVEFLARIMTKNTGKLSTVLVLWLLTLKSQAGCHFHRSRYFQFFSSPSGYNGTKAR